MGVALAVTTRMMVKPNAKLGISFWLLAPPSVMLSTMVVGAVQAATTDQGTSAYPTRHYNL